MSEKSLTILKRLFVAIIGLTLLAIGIAMIVLPGPAIVMIPLALGILASEFAWARYLLHRFRERIERLRNNINHNQSRRTP
ncbi:PGPGW domain-containing protein [Geomonas agri]|uniref:PGPGW domain-containing protein n=1 Tax=Geomonas agri TaxID=2873702 RepID=UPI001CD2F6B8|nr:PGPGW domain-containing protein [Geomonas agri]